jgi:hypothetical protein
MEHPCTTEHVHGERRELGTLESNSNDKLLETKGEQRQIQHKMVMSHLQH